LTAFFASGRLMVMIRTPFSAWVSTSDILFLFYRHTRESG
jgi:hypothetical protein